MLKKVVHYGLGILLIGWIASFITVSLLTTAPYIISVLIVTMPLMGLLKNSKKLNHPVLSVKKWFGFLWKVFKMGKRSIGFYLVLGCVIGFVFDDIIRLLATTSLVSAVAFVSIYSLWEVSRKGLSKFKKISLPSFKEAFLLAWHE